MNTATPPSLTTRHKGLALAKWLPSPPMTPKDPAYLRRPLISHDDMCYHTMHYRERTIPEIERWVECVWSVETAQAVPSYLVLPDGCIDLIYSPSGHLEVVGAMTRGRRFDLAAQSRTVGVRFRPGMATAFLPVSAHQITDCTVPLNALCGSAAREWESRLAEARSIDHCCQLLTVGIGRPDGAPTVSQRAVEAVTAAYGDVDLSCIAQQAGMTARHLRRRLLDETGLSPKRLCRVLRFRRASALRARSLPWSFVAAQAGYFDQAHLIRDFREFTGSTPMSVLSKTSHPPSG